MQPSASNPLRIGFHPQLCMCQLHPAIAYLTCATGVRVGRPRQRRAELSSVSTIWAPLASLRSRLENFSHFSSIIMMLILMLCLLFRPMLRYVLVSLYCSFRISYARVPSFNCNYIVVTFIHSLWLDLHIRNEKP